MTASKLFGKQFHFTAPIYYGEFIFHSFEQKEHYSAQEAHLILYCSSFFFSLAKSKGPIQLLFFFSLIDPREVAEVGLSPTNFPLFALTADSCWTLDSTIIFATTIIFLA